MNYSSICTHMFSIMFSYSLYCSQLAAIYFNQKIIYDSNNKIWVWKTKLMFPNELHFYYWLMFTWIFRALLDCQFINTWSIILPGRRKTTELFLLIQRVFHLHRPSALHSIFLLELMRPNFIPVRRLRTVYYTKYLFKTVT